MSLQPLLEWSQSRCRCNVFRQWIIPRLRGGNRKCPYRLRITENHLNVSYGTNWPTVRWFHVTVARNSFPCRPFSRLGSRHGSDLEPYTLGGRILRRHRADGGECRSVKCCGRPIDWTARNLLSSPRTSYVSRIRDCDSDHLWPVAFSVTMQCSAMGTYRGALDRGA